MDEMLILISLAKTANVFQDRIIAEAACFLLLMGTFKFPPHVLLCTVFNAHCNSDSHEFSKM